MIGGGSWKIVAAARSADRESFSPYRAFGRPRRPLSYLRHFVQGPQRPAGNAPAGRPVSNQPASAPPNGTNIAVIDINRVFEQHAQFKAAMEDIKTDITNYEATVMDRRKQATALNEEMRTFQQARRNISPKRRSSPN